MAQQDDQSSAGATRFEERDALHRANLQAHGLTPGEITPYRDHQEHLRDELWRVWLRVEYEIRRRWELEALPATQREGSLGIWQPREIGGLFRAAHAELAGADARAADHGAQAVLDVYLRHSARLESRVEATLGSDGEVILPLVEICRRFGLDARQRASLTLALAPEIDPNLLVAYRYLVNEPTLRHLDGRLLSILVYDSLVSRARLAADLSFQSPLIFYRLLEHEDTSGRHDSVLYRRLRPAARLVPLLGGAGLELDPELTWAASASAGADGLFAPALVAAAERALDADDPLILVVEGQRGVGKRTLVETAATGLGRRVLHVDPRALASRPAGQLEPLLRALLREARLLDAVVSVPELDAVETQPGSRETPAFFTLLRALWRGPIAVTTTSERPPAAPGAPIIHLRVPVPGLADRAALWAREVGDIDEEVAGELAERFAIPGGVIALAARAARASADEPEGLEALDRAVKDQLHGRIQRLGVRLDTPHDWDDLVADDDTLAALREISAAVRERRRVRERWGFRGSPGISVLFSGSPGVGKTMSATVVARALGLGIYEIDLSQIMSKWIGETEKNLAEVFDAAEPGHVVLLFNEADSLFGKRTTDVNSSNDRYANLETNYLLQRLERFGGLSILTTNLTKAVDPAFRRRFNYDVQFAFPSAEMRAELWRRAIPAQAEIAGIDYDDLGERFELSGGYIKVAAERAAFNAAAGAGVIEMDVIVDTIERMYRERGKLSAVGRLE